MLHHIKRIIIIYFLMLTTLSLSMNESQGLLKSLHEKNSPEIEFITDDKIILKTLTKEKQTECHIIDLHTDKIIKKIDTNVLILNDDHEQLASSLAINHQRTIFSLTLKNIVALYDCHTGNLLKKFTIPNTKGHFKTIFNALDNTILCYTTNQNEIYKGDYISERFAIPLKLRVSKIQHTACHPKRRELNIISDFSKIIEYKNGIISDKENNATHPYPQYNSAGLLAYCKEKKGQQCIVIADTNINEDKRRSIYYNTEDIQKSFDAIEFHPNNTFLAINVLSTAKNNHHRIIQYFNVKTEDIITQSDVMFQEDYHYSSAMRFSPNGEKIILLSPNNYVLLEVPFEVIKEEKLIYILFLLKNYQIDQHDPLPQDIINLIMQTALETFKRT